MDKIKVGDKVEHKLSGNWLIVLELSDNEVSCRTKDFQIVTLFKWEVVFVKNGG